MVNTVILRWALCLMGGLLLAQHALASLMDTNQSITSTGTLVNGGLLYDKEYTPNYNDGKCSKIQGTDNPKILTVKLKHATHISSVLLILEEKTGSKCINSHLPSFVLSLTKASKSIILSSVSLARPFF